MLNEDAGILVSGREASAVPVVTTLPALLLHSGVHHRKRAAFKFKRTGQWIEVSTDEFLLRVEELFFALRALGLKPGDRVAIISENRLEWAVADYAALCAGALVVPIYPTLSEPQITALLRDCEPAMAFVSTATLLEKVRIARAEGLSIRNIVSFEPGFNQPEVMRLDALYEVGRQTTYDSPGEFRRAALGVTSEQIATIIYTSGTTGVPKGAMLTHGNLVSNILATCERLPLAPTDVTLSFLPLSHIFQRHVDYATIHAGATIAYPENGGSVVEDMKHVQPTFAAAVPRFFEKLHGRILHETSRRPWIIRCLFEQALRIGVSYARTGRKTLAYRAADLLVFRKIRARLGGKIRLFISGGAALEKETAEFFWAAGLPIYEGYGLSETSPVITLNGPGAARIGSVGRVVGGQEVRIADDGEILVRGSNVMKGYYHMERETAEALDGDWFHTGDIGEFDADGFLKITDRKKDLIITSSGKNVAPQAIENRLKLIPYFENAVVIGDGRNFVSALIVPNIEALAAYAQAHQIE